MSPLGKFKDFQACVLAHRQKGSSADEAKRICGEMEKKMKGHEESLKKDGRQLEWSVPIQESIRSNGEFIISGVAINETVTRNGVSYIAEELEKSAHSLIGKPILKDHNNSVDAIVGRVIEASFDRNAKRIPFKAKIIDENMQKKINQGLIGSVSAGTATKLNSTKSIPLAITNCDSSPASLVSLARFLTIAPTDTLPIKP